MSTAGNIKLFKTINQIFHYICCITPKRVARSEFVKFISASLRPGNTASFEEMSQRWRAVGNIVQFDRPDIWTSEAFENDDWIRLTNREKMY